MREQISTLPFVRHTSGSFRIWNAIACFFAHEFGYVGVETLSEFFTFCIFAFESLRIAVDSYLTRPVIALCDALFISQRVSV